MRHLPFDYAVRNLGRRPLRTALTIAASALVTALLVATAAFVRGLETTFAEQRDDVALRSRAPPRVTSCVPRSRRRPRPSRGVFPESLRSRRRSTWGALSGSTAHRIPVSCGASPTLRGSCTTRSPSLPVCSPVRGRSSLGDSPARRWGLRRGRSGSARPWRSRGRSSSWPGTSRRPGRPWRRRSGRRSARSGG